MAPGHPSVCIVGAGAAGLTLAQALAGRGWRVVLLEAGGAEPARELEDSYRVTIAGTPHRGAHEGRFRALGGSTTRWGGQLWAWERHEFEPRPWLGLEGWPIAYDDVAPWYDAAFAILGIPGATLTPDDAAARGVSLPPLDPDRFALKYSTWLPWRLRNLGRSLGAPLRANAQVELRLNTTAVGIEWSGARAAGVRVRRADGSVEPIVADVVVIAGGAIETSRLLLASAHDASAPGDASGWLGRGFMDHLSVRVARFEPRDRGSFGRMFAPIFVGDVQHTPRMLLRPSLLAGEGLLSAYGHWNVELPARSGLLLVREKLRALQAGHRVGMSFTDVRRLAASIPDALAMARGRLLDRRQFFPRDSVFHLRVDTEQLPDRESRVTLAPERDASGLPRVVLDWRVSELEQRTVRRAAELLAGELERQGVGTLELADDPFGPQRDWGELRGDSFHMMGGTRMAKDAGDGVVDTDCRVFGATNLYVAGASVFPTGGMANPTLTLVALTLRLADHLARTH